MSDSYDDFAPELRPAPRRERQRYDPAVDQHEDAYRSAQRHSRWVRWLKYVLPAVVILAGGVFWATARFVPTDIEDLISIAGIDVESGNVVMDRPRISGFEGTRRAYNVEAATAVQSLSDPKVITFNEIDATIGMDDAGTATIAAALGVYDGNVNVLNFDNGVTIETTEGYAARLNSARIDLDAGELVTDQPLQLSSRDGSVHANGVKIEERGKKVAFTGGVRVVFNPPGDLMTTPEKSQP